MPRENSYSKEPNLMGNYFGAASATYQILEIMRKGMMAGERRNVPEKLVQHSTAEVQGKMGELDESTYESAHALNNEIFGRFNRRRVIMVVKGDFIGGKADLDYMNRESRREEGYLIPIDLGENPYPLFASRDAYSTIDEKVTEEQTRQFLADNRQYLRERGFRGFMIDTSRFFYFDNQELTKRFATKSGELDMQRLIPFVSDLPQYLFVNGKIVESGSVAPTAKEYENAAIKFASYRLKQSLAQKLANMLTFPKGEIRKGISDWVAHRVVFPTEEEVHGLESFLRENPIIGFSNSKKDSRVLKIEYRDKSDYYEKPKANGFRSMNIIVLTYTPGYKPSIREIQAVHFGQYHHNEIDVNNPAHHRQQEGKREHVSSKKSELKFHYEGILKEIFGKELVILEI